METLIKETLNYAEIVRYESSCDFPRKSMKPGTFGEFKFPSSKKSSKYFYLDDGRRNNVKLHLHRDHIRDISYPSIEWLFGDNDTPGSGTVNPETRIVKNSKFYTTNDEVIKRFFADPFSSIIISTITKEVYRDGDKLYIKVKNFVKRREVNCKFFRKVSLSFGIIFDLKNGNITSYHYRKSGRGKSSTIRTNYFENTQSVIMSLIRTFNYGDLAHITNRSVDEDTLFNDFTSRMHPDKFMKIFIGALTNGEKSWNGVQSEILTILLDKMVEIKGIKMPNNGKSLLKYHYPGAKFLKKNDNKLVQAVLDSYGIKTKAILKLFHLNENVKLFEIREIKSLFGDKFSKYISNINPDFFIPHKEEKLQQTQVPLELRLSNGAFSRFDISEKERENAFKLIRGYKERGDSIMGGNILSLLRDHFSMIETCREFYPDLFFSSNTWEQFNEEHMRLSGLVKKIRKGTTIEYVYDNRLIRDIETQLGDIKPYILKTSQDYDEEGDYMHHCVATYSNKDTSIIVSLRDNTSKDRVTCEFAKKMKGGLLQARYFSNGQPPEKFNEIIEVVSKKIEKHSKSRLLDHLEVRKVPIKINGVEVQAREIRFDIDPFLGY